MPNTASTPDWSEERARDVAGPHLAEPGGMLPSLQAIQKEFGWIPKPAIGWLAQELNLSRAEVYGAASFYHDFRLDGPAGRHVLKLCRAEACQAVGADAVADCARQRLGVDWHGTSSDGSWTLEPVYCLGLCASGPSAMLDGELAAALSPEKLLALIGECE